MNKPKVCIIGDRGIVSQQLQSLLAQENVAISVIRSQTALDESSLGHYPEIMEADLVVLSVLDFASPTIFPKLPADSRVLDISPAFRIEEDWVYGLRTLAGQSNKIRYAKRVANPGCFATAALLMLEPLVSAGLLPPDTPLYLDGTGGYTTGGSSMVRRAEAGELHADAVFSLTREHRHVAEIRAHAGLTGPVWFTPKIGDFARGIRMQVPLFGLSRETVLACLKGRYDDTIVLVSTDCPSKIAATERVGSRGATIRVIERPDGCLLVCTLDNLRMGGVDTVLKNIRTMLNLQDPDDLS